VSTAYDYDHCEHNDRKWPAGKQQKGKREPDPIPRIVRLVSQMFMVSERFERNEIGKIILSIWLYEISKV
jgi:hypothetical protein